MEGVKEYTSNNDEHGYGDQGDHKHVFNTHPAYFSKDMGQVKAPSEAPFMMSHCYNCPLHRDIETKEENCCNDYG